MGAVRASAAAWSVGAGLGVGELAVSRRRCCCSCSRRSCRGWGRRRCWRGCRTRCSGAVSAAGVQIACRHSSAPDDHFISLSVHTAVCTARAAGALVVLVAVQLSVPGLYLPPVFKCCRPIRPRRSFRCRSTLLCDDSGRGRVGGAGGCPTIGAGIVSPAGVKMVVAVIPPQTIISLPVHTAVWNSGSGRVGDAGGCPTIRAGIVSAAGVQKRRSTSPPQTIISLLGPHCRVTDLGHRAHWWCWWLSNYPCWDCISRRCSKRPPETSPPQTIISLPVHTAV